jgi:hypothetical protein
MKKSKIISIRVVEGSSRDKHLRGREYLLRLECGHEIRRTHSRGIPKAQSIQCPKCAGGFLQRWFS